MSSATANITSTTHLPEADGPFTDSGSMPGNVVRPGAHVQRLLRKHAAFGLLLLSLFSIPARAEDAAKPVTLTGNWSGKWTDTRPGYNNSGGSFTCIATETGAGKWHAEFSIGRTRTYKVELSGKREDAKILFDGAVDLGGRSGIYTWKGCVQDKTFSGEYEGPGEKGSFRMALN